MRAARPVRPDTFALIPASQLPYRRHWESVANGLPTGAVLVVYPTKQTALQAMVRAVVPHLRARGRHVTAVPADEPS